MVATMKNIALWARPFTVNQRQLFITTYQLTTIKTDLSGMVWAYSEKLIIIQICFICVHL